ncbi:poly(hydroxyalkanoate) depolymerase family esterase [Streptomyces sp. V4I23]|uniref:extracellular catalytic domain type 1 short-chain-length polyhydroxyalkanoate depolymerase n=1 Tax=Streptomyces sp. V4I23 TaxID=3042282 RepID=UPI00277F450B|nr:PHB depolymerase family esterase [Streptomyces sp. V4I23]MDQ1012549.1 poly(hydroxyalkanoate) depolymerase family esterase [Streptomyces sp. V4I23]
MSQRMSPRPRGPRSAGRLAAVLAVLLGCLWAVPVPAAYAAVPLERVTGFGSNPGNLAMYVHRPASLPAEPAVVVALHGCTQSAQVYADNSGLAAFADRHGFLLVLAQTTASNNPNSCFNWFQAADSRRGQGEAASVRQMVAHAESAYGADPSRTFVTGLSAGGAMTAVVLAAYPDVFEAGAVIAGIPYDCTRDTGPFTCMSPGTDRTPSAWAQRVRDAYPSYTGPWPRVAIWHGDDDTTVAPMNAGELRDQWTAVHGLGQVPDRTGAIGPNGTRREQYLNGGEVAVEVDRVPAIGHGTPVDPGSGPESCGATGTPHFIVSICSSLWVSEFFGLAGDGDPDPGGLPAPNGLAATGADDSSVSLRWDAVDGAAGYALYRDGVRIAAPAGTSHTDTGLAPGSSYAYSVAARDAQGSEGVRSGAVTASTTGRAAACWTSSNYAHVQAGRATTAGGYAYARGSGQYMGLNNTFVTHTLKESPAGYFVVADGSCL